MGFRDVNRKDLCCVEAHRGIYNARHREGRGDFDFVKSLAHG